ncbi:MAG TPA: SDR family oxidoreductase [Noviherbaspirillum sp.]|uniref:SDR family oxidoreductase n=1 Tax=Noviherbaspirillum sp. TaxID=1926288 RepID=UPI002DDD58CA|nr:SDR family oxidoreductase [Noviherbaspirillum sp.]HEV2609882.1 SDR family oxidoreductase [Noviherbaspirillum sp.]
MKNLKNATVVITGASSGMGLATALAFARRGANLALAARSPAPLEQAARQCEAHGGRALAVPTDVTDAEAMRALARAAINAYGRIDVWINNAGMSLWGPFEDIPVESQQQLVNVNLNGVINGCHAVVPHFLRNGGRGIIINMASIGGRVPMPWLATYSASKFAVAGLTDALRYELASRSAIEVCGMYPGFVDTPTNLHSSNYTGRELRPVPPVIDPCHVAEQMVSLALHPRRASYIGAHHALAYPYALMPEPVGRLLGHFTRRYFMQSGRAAAPTDGSLFKPVPAGAAIHGQWGVPQQRKATVAVLALTGVAAACAFALRRGRNTISRPAVTVSG